jgi:hypothetical protein
MAYYWLVKMSFDNPGMGPPVQGEQPPPSRSVMLSASGRDGVWFVLNAMVEANTEEEAIAEARPIMTYVAEGRGCPEVTEILTHAFDTKEELGAAL